MNAWNEFKEAVKQKLKYLPLILGLISALYLLYLGYLLIERSIPMDDWSVRARYTLLDMTICLSLWCILDLLEKKK